MRLLQLEHDLTIWCWYGDGNALGPGSEHRMQYRRIERYGPGLSDLVHPKRITLVRGLDAMEQFHLIEMGTRRTQLCDVLRNQTMSGVLGLQTCGTKEHRDREK
jgi:hypothetical protein